jgi:hypothetical protein
MVGWILIVKLNNSVRRVRIAPLWRRGRVAEGAPLLREYRVCSPIEGSNPSVSAKYRLYPINGG